MAAIDAKVGGFAEELARSFPDPHKVYAPIEGIATTHRIKNDRIAQVISLRGAVTRPQLVIVRNKTGLFTGNIGQAQIGEAV